MTNAATYYRDDEEEVAELGRRFADAAREAGYEVESELELASGLPTVSLSGTAVGFDGRALRIAEMGSSEDAAIVARLARRLDWPALVVEGGVRLADLMAIAGAAEGVFMINRAPSAGARDLISRAFYPALKDDIARHDPLGVAAEFLASFEAKAASTREHVPAKEAFTDAIGENDRRPPTNLVPTAAPVRPDKVAEPASAFTPSVATLGNDARHLAAVSDMRRTTGSRFEDFEMIPDDDSWKKRPDPAELARNARLMQAYTQRQRRQEDDADNIMQRMSDRSSGLQSDDPRPPRR